MVALTQANAAVYYGFLSGSKASITGSEVILEEGTVGTSVVYMNATSAYSEADSHSTTFYPNDYNVTHGAYNDGTTPGSLSSLDGNYFVVDGSGSGTTPLEYYPSSLNLLGNTSLMSGSLINLTSNDGVYLSLLSYRSNLNYTNYVDNNLSDADSKDDVGTHSNFTAQQGGPNGVHDTLSEVQVPEDTAIDYVDNNSSNVDGVSNSGTNSNFENEKAVDAVYNLLTEQQFYVYEWLDCNIFDGTWQAWYADGTSPYIDAQDEPLNIIYEKSNGQREGWFGFQDTGLVGSLNLNITIYCRNIDGAGDDHIHVYVDYTGTGSGSYVGDVGAHANWQYDTINLGAHTVSDVDNLRVYFEIHKSGASNNVYVDHARIGVRGVNHRLDIENQFTSVDTATNYDVSEICVKTGATGSEDLTLSIWNMSSGSWSLLASDLTGSGWTNVTVTDRVSSTMTMRFLGGTEALDTSQDTWQVDAVLVKHYNLTYRLDLEVQWTGLNYTRVNEILGIYGGAMSAEDILVDVWYNNTWNNVFTDLVTGWNNASISQYLDSPSCVIRFRDAVTAKDRVQDTWQIDASVIRTWSDEFTAEIEFEGPSNLYEWAQLIFDIDSGWSNNSIGVSIQLYDFNLGSYPSSGQGYLGYTSGASGVDENKTLFVATNPEDYRNSTGWWRVKVKGVADFNDRFQGGLDLARVTTDYYSEYVAETEFIFTDVTDNQSPYLNFTVVTHNSVDGAEVTIQVWNYTSASFPLGGEGYLAYVSTGFNNTSRLNVTLNPDTCLSGSYVRIRVTSTLDTTVSYQQKTNLVRLLQEESQGISDYALRITNTGADPYTVRLNHLGDAGIDRLINCTIYLTSGGTQIQVLDGVVTVTQGAWVSLDGYSSLDIVIAASSTTLDHKSTIYAEVEALKSGTSTYTKLPILFSVY